MFNKLRSIARRTFGPRRPRIVLIQGDITRQDTDVIVNAAKASLMGGGGVDGAIHRAGGPEILAECRKLRAAYPAGLAVGQAVPTTAGRLNAEYVIHTVGPMYFETQDGAVLRSCYTSSLKVADRLRAQTVAFPLISSGVYGWPTHDALRQALMAIANANTRVKEVRLVLFDTPTYRTAQRMKSWMEIA